MAYAILRTKKLKSMAALARSLRHTFREQETPNADNITSHLNPTVGVKGAVQVMAAFDCHLPEKRRKDAVIAIEYLITASPEAFTRHGGHLEDSGSGYFEDALKWLNQRHGESNVISSTIHLDEITPHMVAYVVPKTTDERLSARDFLGGPKLLRDMQDSFFNACGPQYQLDRGVKGSKAKHDDIKSFYSMLNSEFESIQLSQEDYALAAMGVKTDAIQKAEEMLQAQSLELLLARRNRKADEAREKAVQRAEQQVELLKLELEKRMEEMDLRESLLNEREQKIQSLESTISYQLAS